MEYGSYGSSLCPRMQPVRLFISGFDEVHRRYTAKNKT